MRKYFLILLLIPNIVLSQYTSKDFTFDDSEKHVERVLSLSLTNKDSIISYEDAHLVSGFFVSGKVVLYDSTQSYIRISIEDSYQNEYLVYENYPLLSDSKCSFSKTGIETASLDNILVKKIKIETRHSSVQLDSIYFLLENNTNGGMTSDRKRQLQCEYIAVLLNSRLMRDNKTWRAGVTDIAMMTYEEKKNLFGGKVPILYGLDYYKGGVFVMPGYEDVAATNGFSSRSAAYVQEWDWRNRHGKNWMTPIKNQGACGSCWAFSPIGTLEAYINLYFNQLLNYNLSEQDVLSCSGGGTCSSGYINDAFEYIKSSGSIPENCFVYSATDESCNNQCASPDDIVSFEQYNSVSHNDTAIKNALLKNPISFGISSWSHFLVLAGYKQIQSGQYYFISSNSSDSVIILPNNPLIGHTAWLLNNSWGTSWGNNGYGYVAIDLSDAYGLYKIFGSVSSSILNENNIICEDADQDGYYFWGIGPKPANCPICCPDVPDGDDANPLVGELDGYGNPQPYSFPYESTIINNNQTWNTNRTQCGSIIVTNNATLTVTATLTMNPSAKIILQDGGKLIVNGGSIINSTIEVNNSAKLQLLNDGMLYLKQRGNIEVLLGGEANLDYGRVLIQ